MIEYDEFSSEEEIKRDLQNADGRHGSGPVLYIDWENGEPLVSNSESNGIFLGVTGCGKTRRGTIPMTMSMIQANESVISVDPKGDIFKYTYALAKERGYHTLVFDFRDMTKGDGFDIFGYAYEKYNSGDPSDKQQAIDLIKSIGDSLYGDDEEISGRKDPFWDSSAKSFFMALMYILFEYGTAEQAHPASLIQVAHDCFSRIGPTRIIEKACELFPDAPFVPLVSNVRSAPNDTLGSIKSSFFQPMNVFLMSETIRQMMSDASFKMSDLDGKKKVAIYIILPDENTNYSSLAAIILSQIVSHHIRIAHTKYDGSLPRRLNVVIEELGNIGASLPMLPSLMTAGRSRHIRTFFVLQSFSQLDTLYGPSKAATIIGNADTLIAYRTSELDTLIRLSKKVGEKFDEDKDRYVPIITPTQLASLDTGEILVMRSGRLKYTTHLPDFTELINYRRLSPPDHVPSRGQIKTDKFSFERFIMGILKEQMEKRDKERQSQTRDYSGFFEPLPSFMKDPTSPFSKPAVPEFSTPKIILDPKAVPDEQAASEKKSVPDPKHEAEYQEIRNTFGLMLGEAIGKVADKKSAAEKSAAPKTVEKKPTARKPAAQKPVSRRPAKLKKPEEPKKKPDNGSESTTVRYGLVINYGFKDPMELRKLQKLCCIHSAEEPTFRDGAEVEVYFPTFEQAARFSDVVYKTLGVRNMTLRCYRS